ncbi:MAG: hypothetical protein M1813_003619 [Trichoglossum hirsutum]|nr:MAG: hypothetical protein M1813_003619 [Trichoglossum hirsutum]
MLTYLRLGFALVSVIPIALASLIARSPVGGALAPRQACPLNFGTCSSNVGLTICIAPDEFCCQIAGINPFACPSTHPFCCPGALCGSTNKCSGPVIDAPTATPEATATATATSPAGSTSSGGQASTATTTSPAGSASSGGQNATATQSATATSSSGSSGPKVGQIGGAAMGFARDPALIVAAVGLSVVAHMVWL